MDEGSGTTAIDSSGNGNDGTITNATLSSFHSTTSIPHPRNGTIQPGRAYEFDGVNDKVIIPYDSSLDISSEFTMLSKIKYEGGSSDLISPIVMYGVFRSTIGTSFDKIRVIVNNSSILTASTPLIIGETYDIAWVHSSSQGFDKVFVNGSTDTYGINTSYSQDASIGGASLSLGGYYASDSYQIQGNIYDTRIYDYALSNAAIQTYHNSIYSALPTQENQITIPNGGGTSTTDWLDTNTDGLADNWSKDGNLTASIVTGNGFIGNAQRVLNTGGAGQGKLYWLNSVQTSTKMRISFKYRSSSTWNFQIATGAPIESMPTNTGNAAYVEFNFVSNISPYITFKQSNLNEWLEIDEINITEIFTPEPIAHYKMDESDGEVAYDSSGNGNHGTITNATLSTFHSTDPEGSDWQNQFGYTEALVNETAGTAYTESGAAYGTWEYDFYRETNNSNASFIFISDKESPRYNDFNGYRLYFLNYSTGIYLKKDTIGSNVTLLYTADGYIENQTHYKIKITRTTAGIFTAYIKGGSFGDNYVLIDVTGGGGSNPVTDNTYTTSEYLGVDLDPGDQISNLTLDGNGVSLHNFTEGTGTFAKPLIPRDESDTTKDINGSDLQYSGRANYHAKLVGSHAGTFDGSNDYITVPYSSDIAIGNGPFSLDFYIKINNLSSPDRPIIGRRDNNQAIVISYNSSGNLVASLGGIGNYTSSLTLTTGETARISIIYDGTDLHFYKNETPVDSLTIPTPTSDTSSDLFIGEDGFSTIVSANAELYGISIWNAEKTISEILARDTNNLGAHYPFAEGSGTTIYDASGNGNHGTATNITEGTFWGSTQDEYHYNLTKGFTLSGSTKIPADFHENGKDAQGNFLTNPPGPYHNNAETKLQQYAAPQVINSDSLDGGNFWFDTNFDPRDMSYSEFTTNVGSRAHAKTTSSIGNSSYQEGRWRLFAE